MMKNLPHFICHSPAATAVCISPDPCSAVVPRRPLRADAAHGDCVRLVGNAAAVRYSKFVESPSLSRRREGRNPAVKKPAPVTDGGFQFQVVVMRVAIHCQGCARKVKRHLTKMEGVTSFSIDVEAKRVTVMGHISPVGVLESISKVKRAELWPTLSQ